MRPTNIGAHVKLLSGGTAIATAGGTGDATELDGPYGSRVGYASVSVWLQYHAVLAEGATLTVAANIQDDADGAGSGTDFGSAYAATVVATGGSGGSTETGCIKLFDTDLTEAEGYIRGQHTPNLSAANTDTSRTALILVLGGASVIPAT